MVRRNLLPQAISLRHVGIFLIGMLLTIVAPNGAIQASEAAGDGDAPLASLPPPPGEGASSPPAPIQIDPRTSQEPIPAKVYRYAERLITEADANNDRSLERQEWPGKWGFLPADADLDGRVTLDELVQRIAEYGQHRRIRLLPPTVAGEGNGFSPGSLPPTSEEDRLAASGNASFGPPPSADDGTDMAPKNAANLARKFVPSRARQPEGLPSWFATRDADGDGQLSLAEFAPKATGASLAEFDRYDRNGDGVMTPDEYLRAVKSAAEEKGK